MHGKVPQQLENCNLVYLLYSCGDISDAGNYIPVFLATTISKLLEKYILSCISPFITTTGNQFSFKSQHRSGKCVFLTDMCA